MIKNIIYELVLLAGCLNGGFNFKKLSPPFRFLLYLLILTFITETFAYYAAIRWRNNLLIYNLYTPLHFIIVSSAYYRLINLPFFKRGIRWLCVLFVLYSAFVIYVNFRHNEFPFVLIIADSIIITTVSFKLPDFQLII